MVKVNTMERIYIGITKEIQRKSKGHTKGMYRVCKGETKANAKV